MALHSEPGRVRNGSFEWTPDEQRVVYSAEKLDDPGEFDLYMVDLGGPQPAPPVKLSAPFGPGGGVALGVALQFGAGSDRMFYFTAPGAKQTHDLWMVGLDPVTPAVQLSAPQLPSSYTPGDLAVSSDLARVAYVATHETEGLLEQWLVELAGPSAPVKLDIPLASGSDVDFGSEFSADGRRLFFVTKDEADKRSAFQIDVTPAPGVAVPVSDPGHDVDSRLIVLPVGGA